MRREPGEKEVADLIGRAVFCKPSMPGLIELICRYHETTDFEASLRVADDIIRMVEPPLRLFLALKITDPGSLDDVSQETLVGVARGLSRFRGDSEGQAWAWCYQIARNKMNDRWRQQAKSKMVFLDPADLWPVVDASAQEAPIPPDKMEALDRAMHLLKASNSPCYDYLFSRYLLGWDNKMIAEAFGLNYDSVHVTLKRCRDAARALVIGKA